MHSRLSTSTKSSELPPHRSRAKLSSEPANDGMFREPALRKWGRRLVTFPGILTIIAIHAAILPLAIPYSIVRDLSRGRRHMPLLRFHAFIFGILVHHVWGVFLLSISWCKMLFLSPQERRDAALNVEITFIPQSIAIAEKSYDMDIEIDNVACCSPGPILLLSRHASILDTIMPIKILGQALGMGLRIVQKDQLLWNPLVDVASRRMPRAFIKRNSGDVDAQLGHMKHLLSGITDNEALLLFPEGSRFSEEKKQRIVAKLKTSNPVGAARAKELRHVLPMRPTGTNALIDAQPDVDVVFMAHTGLESANRLEDFLQGKLYQKKIRMKFWRVAAADIPTEHEERNNWMHNEWLKLDEWIDANRE